MFSDRTDGDFFSFALGKLSAQGIDKTKWIASPNLERDWLKHTGAEVPEPMSFGADEAALMLVRATSKLDVWSPGMDYIKPLLLEQLV